ncbi:unnamed protein product [Phyllotreta striolata]|uniref:C2 domain-containing protein n=1 Tax=Phyllotreta striolata TaxID=444603 RepID=A0A9N9XUC5_PHYSR|nr:unnamed protein product [Phyllotreta striolata]
MGSKKEVFLIAITILEGRHYVWPNMDSAVIIRIDNIQKSTTVKRNTDAPYYNEYFVFEFFSSLEDLLDKTIAISVVMPSTIWRHRKILGYISFDVATVWQQTNHQFYHKWAILSSMKTEAYVGPRGYLKLDISVLAKGEIPKVSPNVFNDEIEGNLLLPEGKFTERQKAKYIFEIYCCKNLANKPINFIQENTELTEKTKLLGPTTFVEITFAGVSVRTSTKKNTSSPQFNEKLTIIDLFPPLCQTIKIDVCYGDTIRKLVHSEKLINLRQISNDHDEGFLPTLGPIYLHLSTKNHLEGYAGTILMAMNTEVNDLILASTKKGTLVESIQPINEDKYFDSEGITLLTMIYEVTALSKKYTKKPVTILMTFGDTLIQKKTFDGIETTPINSTGGLRAAKLAKSYYFLNLFDEKPCLWIFKTVPYFKKRVYNSNILNKIARGLKLKLNEIEALFDADNSKETSLIASQKLLDVIDFVLAAGKKYIDIISSYSVEFNTKLDIQRTNLCIKEMTDIIEKTASLDGKYSNKKTFRKLQKVYNRIDVLINDVQDCWPDIILWLVHGVKQVALCKIPARDVIFSQVDEERGDFCGVQQTLSFHDHYPDKKHLAAKMEMKMFLILDRHKPACKAELPPEINYDSIETIPTCLTTKSKQRVELRCYIFQGKIIAGFDKTGLADTFVRIISQNQLKDTRVITKCLNPIWDQTLVFSDVVIDEFHFPSIILEIYDKDEMVTSEFIGRTIVKPYLNTHNNEYEPPKLTWIKVHYNEEVSAEVLSAFEYVELTENEGKSKRNSKIVSIPVEIKPQLVPYKMEVLFWGVRELGKVNFSCIKRPRISIFCGDNVLYSDTLENAHKNPNFEQQVKSLSLILPVEREYMPPLRLRMQDSRRFGVYTHAGVHITKISPFLVTPTLLEDRRKLLNHSSAHSLETCKSSSASTSKVETLHINMYQEENGIEQPEIATKRVGGLLYRMCSCVCRPLEEQESRIKSPSYSNTTYETFIATQEYVEDYDWWSKFHASIQDTKNVEEEAVKKIRTLKIYESELEQQPEFKGFADILTAFQIMKGKRTGDNMIDKVNISGVFKGSVRIYQWPLEGDYVGPDGYPLEDGIYNNYPDNTPQRFLLRVYIIRALGLRPKDLSGLSDPYLVLKLNDQILNDKSNYVAKNVNPDFGRCFEFKGTFPQDYLLKISVWDKDIGTADDLIGATEIDLENRFYSKHMASCGISEAYEETGYNAWRCPYRPSMILADLCKRYNLDEPAYEGHSVRIGGREFSSGGEEDVEVLALAALRRWKEMPAVGFPLVPEHVETRSLFHPTKPGIEQGKLQMWLDIFPASDLPPPPKVNVSIRKPEAYELRVVVWNTEDIVLDEDDFYSGDKKSDIYIKGWVIDPAQAQYTDVHYRSLTGEGNFNWRFVFRFDYLPTENKIVVRKKETVFSVEHTECKIPCQLTLQVWDNDTFSKDDFIGTVTLELAKLHRPAKAVNKCTLHIVEKGAPTINLFKIRRTKGWWPLRGVDRVTKMEICAGKIEAEMDLLAVADADKEPAGLGRREPQALPAPNRPDTSFSWLKNPFKALKFLMCKVYKWKLLFFLLIVVLVLMAVSFFYALPKTMLNAFFAHI